MTEQRVIVISDGEQGLPYSKGLRASQLMVTGLSPFRAYQVAEQVEERLRERG
jgi:2-phosphoglycerate kinase